MQNTTLSHKSPAELPGPSTQVKLKRHRVVKSASEEVCQPQKKLMSKKKFPCLNLSGLLIYILDSIHVTKTHSKIKSPVEPDRPHLSFMAYNQQNTKKYTECLP